MGVLDGLGQAHCPGRREPLLLQERVQRIGNSETVDGRKPTDPRTKFLICLPIFLHMLGIDVDPTLGYPQAAALALQDGQVFGRQLMLTAILPKADECGGHVDRVLVAIDRRTVLPLLPIDGQISERIVLLDAPELVLESAEGFQKLGDGSTGEMPIRRSGDQKVVPIGVRGRYVQELALRKIPAIVPAKLLQVHGLRNDRPLFRCQFGVNVESVAGVQGEHDAERHLLNVRGRLAYPIANRDSLMFEIFEDTQPPFAS